MGKELYTYRYIKMRVSWGGREKDKNKGQGPQNMRGKMVFSP